MKLTYTGPVHQCTCPPMEFPVTGHMPWGCYAMCWCGDERQWSGEDPALAAWIADHAPHKPADMKPLRRLYRAPDGGA